MGQDDEAKLRGIFNDTEVFRIIDIAVLIGRMELNARNMMVL